MKENIMNEAHRRVRALLDEGSFMEIGGEARSTVNDAPSDGVITGFGNIEGMPVYIYCQDPDAQKGSIGRMHASKILRIYELAIKTGAPIIGMIDSAGLRLDEANDLLNEFGKLYRAAGDASGVVPQISCVMGMCGGGMSIIPAMSDFVFMKNEGAKMFVNSPNSLEDLENDDITSAQAASEYGVVDFIGTEEEIIAGVRKLIAMLPANFEDDTSYAESNDDPNREIPQAESLKNTPHELIAALCDNGIYYERRPEYEKDIITAIGRMDGTTVGFIANRDITDDGDPTAMLTPQAAYKAAYFIRFCDAFSIPIVSLVNMPGFARTVASEKKIAKAVARLMYYFSASSTPKISVVTGDAYGTAFLVMCSRPIGVDFVYAWETSHIGMVPGREAAKLFNDGKHSNYELKAIEFDKKFNSTQNAEAAGLVDAVIPASETRKYVIGSLRQLFSKREARPPKKHGSL